jgi:CheY-like chemotaxis protein
VVNARDAMPGGGSVSIAVVPEIAAGADAAGARITVSDTGPGVPADLRDRVWDPLFTTKAAIGGSGLGLAVVSRAAREAGGSVEVGEAPGGGARFGLWLPPAARPAVPPRPRRQPARPASGRVLVVDDDEVTRGLIGRLLGRLGYDVATAPTGEGALLVLDDLPVLDYLIADLTMSGIGGLELAAEVRRLRPATGIVIASGHPDALSGTSLPVGSRFLQKPFDLDDLAEALDAVTGGAG